MTARTLFDKVWDRHVVVPETAETPGVMYVDLHLVHEVTSPQAFSEIAARGLKVRRPDRTFATLDHSTPTLPAGPDGQRPYVTEQARNQVETLEAMLFGGPDWPEKPLVDQAEAGTLVLEDVEALSLPVQAFLSWLLVNSMR